MKTKNSNPASRLDYVALNTEFCQLLSEHENDTEIINDEDRKDCAEAEPAAEFYEEDTAPIYNAFRELCERHEADGIAARCWWVFGLTTAEESKDYPVNPFDVYVTGKD